MFEVERESETGRAIVATHENGHMNVRRVALEFLVRFSRAEIIGAAYRGLFGREAEFGETAKYSPQLRKSGDLVKVLKELCGREEHWQFVIGVDRKSVV